MPTTFINPKVTGSLNSFMVRDDSGRAEVNEPTTAKEIANKQYVDGEIAKVGGNLRKEIIFGSQVSVFKVGRWVFINVRDAMGGYKGQLSIAFRPIEDVDFFLTVPNRRGYPGFCNVLTNGKVEINFSGETNSSDRGFGCATYLAAE